MLHPRNNLTLLSIENVVKEDVQLGEDDYTFLAVDLTEYYGGVNSEEAERVVIVQVKYSPLRSNITWTSSSLGQSQLLEYLTPRKRKSKRSVNGLVL